MRKSLITQLIATSVFGIACAGTSYAETINLYDYDEADSSYEDAFIAGSANVAKSRNDQQSSYDLNLDLDYEMVVGSRDRDITIEADADGFVTRSGTAGAKSIDGYTAGASAFVDNYFQPGSSAGFWFAGGSVRGNDASSNFETKLTLGIGYGRVLNVTPMARALRVIEALHDRGSISASPSRLAYQQIAKIIAREDEYISRYGRTDYLQYWISDITNILENEGVFSGSLDTAGILEARDVLVDEKISTRKIGWKVRAGVGYVGRNFDGIKDNPSLELGAEYHHPLSNKTQFSNEAVFSTILDSGDNAYNVNNRMTLTHEIADRIDWENAWTLDYNNSSNTDTKLTTNTLSSTFTFELRNALDFTLTAQVINVEGGDNDGTDRALLMGIRYRLL